MVYKEFGATIAPSNVSSTGFPIAIGTHIGGGRIVNDKTTLNSKHWCLLGEGATLNDQKANAIGQIWYDTLDNKYWKLDSWASENPVWVDVSTIFATRSYVDDAIENIPDPMIFKGSLGTGGTITSLPTASTSNTGFTYKVITAGTYAGQIAKIGDTFISDGTIWNLIPSGDDSGGGSVTSITLNATSPILIDDSNAITTSGTRTFSHANTSGNKHIPSGGNSNNYLKWDSDGTATWSALPTASTSVAGITTVGASGGAASYVHTHGNITNDGAIGTTSGLMVRTTTSGVLTTLPVGSSGQFLQYDGTWATPTTYSLPLASDGTRGGVQIGYTATGANLPLLLSSETEKGYVTLTSSSITTGLGYTPYDSTNPNGYNTGTVTNIATGTGLTGGPITTTGTIDLATAYGDSVNPYASKTAKFVLAAPNVSDGVPSFRALVASDIPMLHQDTDGTAGAVASYITFNDGGTGDASETTYNGSTARTISYNTIGAAASNHNHDTAYLGLTATATDSDKLDGYHASDFAPSTHTHDYTTSTDVQTLINTAIASVYKPKGNIADKTALLALTNIKQGDVYNAQSAFTLINGQNVQNVKIGDNIVCLSDAATSSETNWDNLGGNIDFAAALSQTLIDFSATSGDITSSDTILSAINKLAYDKHMHGNSNVLDLTTEAFTTSLKTKLDNIEANANKNRVIKVNAANLGADSKPITFLGNIIATYITASQEWTLDFGTSLLYRGVLTHLTDLDNLSNPSNNGIWELNTNDTYYNMPSPYCGTMAERTIEGSEAELIVNVLPSASVTQKIHFTNDNKYHIRTFDKTDWTPWERVITCKDAVGDEVPAVLDGNYTINISEFSSNSTIYNHDKEEILLVLNEIEDYVNNQYNLGNSGVFTFKHTLRFNPPSSMSPTVGFTYNGNLNLAPAPNYLDPSLITTPIALIEFTFKVFYANNQINTSVSNIIY